MRQRIHRALQALRKPCHRAAPEVLGPDSPEAGRARDALAMREFGIAIYRQRMRREHPSATEAEIDAMVQAWLEGRDDDA